MIHQMKLREEAFHAIKEGRKDIELRLYDKKRKAMWLGDYIAFSSEERGEVIYAIIKGMHRFPDFASLYAAFPKERLGYAADAIASPDDMQAYYSIEEQQAHKVVGIEIALQSAPHETVDIHSKGDYPANVLSNFYPHAFTFDGVFCASMEGFLQSLKYKNKEKQKRVASLVGKEAKAAGEGKWLHRFTGRLFWQGKVIHRYKKEYAHFLSRAYEAMFEQNKDELETALWCTEKRNITHSIGKKKRFSTILTEKEFVDVIYALRVSLTKFYS